MNELDEKIARGDAGLKIAEERAARRRQLAGLVAEEQRAADVEHQTDLIMTDLEKRTANVKENIAKNEADRAALSQAEADLLKTDHRIELAEGFPPTAGSSCKIWRTPTRPTRTPLRVRQSMWPHRLHWTAPRKNTARCSAN